MIGWAVGPRFVAKLGARPIGWVQLLASLKGTCAIMFMTARMGATRRAVRCRPVGGIGTLIVLGKIISKCVGYRVECFQKMVAAVP